MDVRKVRVGVRERLMRVHVRVRLAHRITVPVGVLMVRIVTVPVTVR